MNKANLPTYLGEQVEISCEITCCGRESRQLSKFCEIYLYERPVAGYDETVQNVHPAARIAT